MTKKPFLTAAVTMPKGPLTNFCFDLNALIKSIVSGSPQTLIINIAMYCVINARMAPCD